MKNRKDMLEKMKAKFKVPDGLSTHEAAAILNISSTTLIGWLNKKKIKCFRTLGNHRRIPIDVIERFSKELCGTTETLKIPDKKIKNNKLTPEPIPTSKPILKPQSKSKPIPKSKVKKSVLKPQPPLAPKVQPKSKSVSEIKQVSKKTAVSKKENINKKSSKPINKI